MPDAPSPRRLLIVAHSPSENTRRLTDALVRGATAPEIANVEVVLRPPLQAVPEDVLAAQAIILGTTENLGYMSGALKDFFDRIYYPCLEKTQGLPYVLYIRAGQDGTGTSRAVERITTGLALARRAGAAHLPRRLPRGIRRAMRGARHAHGRRAGGGDFLAAALRRHVP